MTLVTRSASASLDSSTGMFAPQTTGNLYAGEALDVLAACYIKASDGKVYMSNGTSANEAAKFDGFTPRACAAGEPVTLFGIGARFRYGTGLTVGADYYVAATAGRLDTAPTVGGTHPVARVLHGGTDIRVTAAADRANSIGGVAGGYKIARGQHTTVSAADTVATGLATVVSVVASYETDPADANELVSAQIGDQAGAPAAGSIIIKTWKNDGTDPTPVAASAFTKKVNWIAVGT